DPPAGKSYLQFLDCYNDDGATFEPFSRIQASASPRGLPPEALLSKADAKRLKAVNEEMDLTAAVALDAAVNGTSLMLVFQVRNTHLLFPGDAQWGTWRVVLDDPEWRALLAK